MDAFLCGDRLLHSRFSMAIEILARIVVAQPSAVPDAELADALGQPTQIVRALLENLHRSGLICQDEVSRDAWRHPPSRDAVTLADVFRSVSAGAARGATARTPCEPRSTEQQNIDLLLMQATVEVNQMVLQHLQSFDLGRLKAVGAAASLHGFPLRARAYLPEPA
ncbi:MAG TPA: hypothetical protein VFF81_15285 [Noviherbaspirillum sp.]|nr:hypothetical protein [Noviherbaspirillum sp.]